MAEWVTLVPDSNKGTKAEYLDRRHFDEAYPHSIRVCDPYRGDTDICEFSDAEFNALSRHAPEVQEREAQVKMLVEVVESATAQMTYLYKGHFGLPFSLKPHMERLTEALAPFTEATDG